MASVVSDPNGFHRVVFKGLDGKRRLLRLGKCSEKFAITVGYHVEAILNQALMPSRPLPRATAEWLGDISPIMKNKLVAVGLIHPRDNSDAITLGEFPFAEANDEPRSGRPARAVTERIGRADDTKLPAAKRGKRKLKVANS